MFGPRARKSNMAACMREEERLNETLSGLRSTSKGQLNYNSDLGFEDDDPGQFTFSLESFLSQSPEALVLINESMRFDTSGSVEAGNVSSDFPQKKEQLENQADLRKENVESNSGQKIRKENPARLASSIESKNELTIKEYHKESREMAETKREMRAKIFKRRTINLKKETEELLKIKQKQLVEERMKLEYKVVEKNHKDLEDLKRQKELLDEKAKEHKRNLDEIYTRALIEESHMAQQEEERKMALENLKKNITSLYHQVLKNVDLIQKKFKDFEHVSFIDGKVYQAVISSLSNIISEAEVVVGKCRKFTDLSLAEDNLEIMNNLIEKTVLINNKAINILQSAEEKSVMATLKKEKEEEEAVKDEELKKEQLKKVERNASLARNIVDGKPTEKSLEKLSSLEKNTPSKDHDPARCISDNALSEYLRLQAVLKDVQDTFKDFTSDPKNTKYKFDLQKAVNVPINALSAHSPSHLNDKIHRLVSLLSGNNVAVGGKNINCNSHPNALAFCKDLVAKKLVMQGAQQVSSNPSSAFIYAAVIVGIWSAFPDVGQLILAHFQHGYPYLVPYYMPKQDDQSINDYHKALGYSIVRDKIEDEDNFLKKFSGTVQLYAAVVSSSGATQADHPHGIAQGWMWLARILNLEPHASVTATMLYHFIKVVGHLLMKQYGKQFQKLLLVLCKEFVPVIDKVTPPEKRGPTQRLKDFLEECIKMQQITVPDGYLTQRWWQSGHF